MASWSTPLNVRFGIGEVSICGPSCKRGEKPSGTRFLQDVWQFSVPLRFRPLSYFGNVATASAGPCGLRAGMCGGIGDNPRRARSHPRRVCRARCDCDLCVAGLEDGRLSDKQAECRHEWKCEGWTIDERTSTCTVCGRMFVFWSQPSTPTSWGQWRSHPGRGCP